MKTRDALQMNMAERREKKSRLLHEIRELEQLERVQELNNEINDDSDDIFNQIEIERRKGYQEYIERLTPDSNQSYSEDDEQNISNTTPEPARTPTMFNVNASEFKVILKYIRVQNFRKCTVTESNITYCNTWSAECTLICSNRVLQFGMSLRRNFAVHYASLYSKKCKIRILNLCLAITKTEQWFTCTKYFYK